MFDAKSLFEQMMRGGAPAAQQSPAGQSPMPDLGDLLRQFTQGGQQGSQQSGQQPAGNTGTSSGNPLEDLLRQFAPGSGSQGSASTPSAPSAAPSAPPAPSAGGSNPLEDLLRQFTQGPSSGNGTSTSAPSAGSAPQGQGGGLGDLIGDIFGKSRQVAGQAGEGTKDAIRDILEKVGGSGAASNDMVRQLTDFINNNKLGAGAALGGLGALVLGTQTGRSIAVSAAKIGALALVGGLAYKAYQNYAQGRPLIDGSIEPEAAPHGSGFEAESVSNEAAVSYIQAMIAAAAADGRIDQSEQERVIGALSQQGLDAHAETFLANELNNPASIEQLAGSVHTDAERLQLYTAARLGIDPDTAAEQQFLAALADRLGITPELRTHVDAAARGAAA